MNNTRSKELKKFYFRDIIRTINKISEEKAKLEKIKNFTTFVFIFFSQIKNIFLKIKIEFYYKLILKGDIQVEKEKNKINYLKIMIQKGEKEILRKNFNKFIRNLIIYNYKKYNNNRYIQDYFMKELNKKQINDDNKNDENRNIQNEMNIRRNEFND